MQPGGNRKPDGRQSDENDLPDRHQPGGKKQPDRNKPGGDQQPDRSQSDENELPDRNQPGGSKQPDRKQPGVNEQPDRNQPGGNQQPDGKKPGENRKPEGSQSEANELPDRKQPGGNEQPDRNQPFVISLQPGQKQSDINQTPTPTEQHKATNQDPFITTPELFNPPVQALCSSPAAYLTAKLTRLTCPPGCLYVKEGSVWGTGYYTDSSSICKAAIHDRRLTNDGGEVIVEMNPGLNNYDASESNGIKSNSYGKWLNSFRFRSPYVASQKSDLPPLTSQPPAATESPKIYIPKITALCSSTAMYLSADVNEIECPSDCAEEDDEGVWGSDVYADFSSMCRAAIHAGLLKNKGGTVYMKKMPGQDDFDGTTRNDIISYEHDEWTEAFKFISPEEAAKQATVTPPPSKEKPAQIIPVAEAVCSSTAEHLTEQLTLVNCPSGCMDESIEVWGTGTYTDDSSLCQAAIHDGRIPASGGKVYVRKTPGEMEYFPSMQNGIQSFDFEEWTGSFVVIAYTPEPPSTESLPLEDNPSHGANPPSAGNQPTGSNPQSAANPIPAINSPHGAPPSISPSKKETTDYSLPEVKASCSMTAKEVPLEVAIIICPANCQKHAARVWGKDTYAEDSSLCRAAIHTGHLGNSGGSVIMQKKPGQNSYDESTKNGITTERKAAAARSFILSLSYDAVTYTEFSYIVPEEGNTLDSKPVLAHCAMTAKELTASITIVICPNGCNSQNEMVWGSDTYAERSSICASAIHAEKIPNRGGSVMVKKIPAQNNFVSTIRNGIKSKSLKESSESFVFSSSSDFQSTGTETFFTISESENTQEFKPTTVPGSCKLTGKELPAPITMVICPSGCKGDVWGTDVYTDHSSVCTAATHTGIVTSDKGGEVIVQKLPGQDIYKQSTRNGVTSKSQGSSSGSFVLSQTYEYLSRRNKNIPQNDLQKVDAHCAYTAKQLPAETTLVICPPGCLAQKESVWGSKPYAQESSVCAAGIHAGHITDKGGHMIVQKKQGQDSYASSTSNGITTKNYGPSTGSFEFISSYDFQSTYYTQATYQLPQTGLQWEVNGGEGVQWDVNGGAGKQWGVNGGAGLQWDANGGGVQWEVNGGAGMNWDSSNPAGVQWDANGGGAQWGVNGGEGFKWEGSTPAGAQWDVNGGGAQWGVNGGEGFKWEGSTPAGAQWDVNGGGMKWDSSNNKGFNWDGNAGSGFNWDGKAGAGFNWDGNAGAGMKWDSSNNKGFNWDGNAGADVKWNINSGADMNWGMDSSAGMNWKDNLPNGGQWDANGAAGETKWSFGSPGETKWDFNSAGKNWDVNSAASGATWNLNSPNERKWDVPAPEPKGKTSTPQQGFFSKWG